MEKVEKRWLAILRILQEAGDAVGSSKIADQLKGMGFDASERTIRYHLKGMDADGLTANLGKRGREITDLGRRELGSARAIEKVGFLAAKIDRMTYRMDFDLKKRAGTVVINVSLIKTVQLRAAAPLMAEVFKAGYSMGNRIGLFGTGEKIGEITVPEGMTGIGTVCSITLNGVLLAHGVPTFSRFGGLLELVNHKPTRFVEIINYEGTSLDPLEIFIRSGMTDYRGATSSGTGRIGVGFREVPTEARDRVIALAAELEKVGLGGFLTIGWPGQALLEIPVSEGRVGVIVIGGLNPTAILEESHIRVQSRALAALAPYEVLFPYHQLDERIERLGD
jgi:HTH-type transcriptional regulator, global nitrogen regulator NrpRI